MAVAGDLSWPLRALVLAPRIRREEIEAFRDRRLRALVAHAYENVPFYRRLMDRNGVAPGDIRGVADLPKIPVSSKQELREAPASEVVARGVEVRKLLAYATSGSSGESTVFRRTAFEQAALYALHLRATLSFGLRLTDRLVRIEIERSTPTARRLGWPRLARIDCLLPPDVIASELGRLRPDVVVVPGAIAVKVAESLIERDRARIRPRIVVIGGEVITPAMRRQVSEGFGARVFEIYASHEFHLIAWECAETGELHTSDDGLVVEVVQDGRPAAPGEAGELVGTNLHAFAMPLIRYRLGDVVTSGATRCRCGAPFGTIGNVQGRVVDYFTLPRGRVLHPWAISVILNERAPWIRRFQLVQEREDRVRLRAVPRFEPSASDLAAVTGSAKDLLGPEVEFEVSLVDEIPLGPAGKHKVFIRPDEAFAGAAAPMPLEGDRR